MGNSAAFGSRSTAMEVVEGMPRVEGKVCIVTGANTGIGIETVRALCTNGWTVIMACRSLERGEKARKTVEAAGDVRLMQLDLASLDSVTAFVEAFKKTDLPLHLLINNAGIMAVPKWTPTADGFESQWGTNHLGHFALTMGLLDLLKANAPSRIVNLSSEAHRSGNWIDGNCPPKPESYGSTGGMHPYAFSKLCNVLFTRELNKRNTGTGVSAYSVHPGVINSELGRHSGVVRIFYGVSDTIGLLKSCPQGAATSVFCALRAPEILECAAAVATAEASAAGAEAKGEATASPSGDGAAPSLTYYADCQLKGESSTARSAESATKLWDISEKLIAEHAARYAAGERTATAEAPAAAASEASGAAGGAGAAASGAAASAAGDKPPASKAVTPAPASDA